MEGKQSLLKDQECLNEDYHQVIKHVPLHTNEITKDPVNTQEMFEQITCHDDVQVIEEKITTCEVDLEFIQLTESRVYDSLSLTSRLRIETELLAKAKAREEVTACTSQSHIQELKENQDQLDKSISELQEFKEKLLQGLEVENLNRTNLEKQMQNTGKMLNILNANYAGLEKTYQTSLSVAQDLEEQSECEIKNYKIKKEQLLETIGIENKNLAELKDILEAENKQFNADLNIKNCTLNQLKDEQGNCANDIENMQKYCENLKNQANESNKYLLEVQSQNEFLRNKLETINLEELEGQKIKKQQDYQKILEGLETDLKKLRDSCDAAESHKAGLLVSLENETDIGNKLEKTFDELENEHSALIVAQEELNKINKKIENKTDHIASVKSEVQATDSRLVKLHEEIAETVKNKENKTENLNILQEMNKELQAKLVGLENQTKKLTEDCEINKTKLSELEQNISGVKTEIEETTTQLLEEKEKYVNAEKKFNPQLEKLDQELVEAQKKFEQVQKESNMRTKALQEELLVYKSDMEKTLKQNRENYKGKLQEMEKKLGELQGELKIETENMEQTKKLIQLKKVTERNLLIELQFANISSQENSQKRKISKNFVAPGILKSVGKSPGTKTVTWRQPSNSSLSSSDTGEPPATFEWKSSDELFAELLRNSPPQRLVENKSKKRPRFD